MLLISCFNVYGHVVPVPSWALVALSLILILLAISCSFCICSKFVFKRKKDKPENEASKKDSIGMTTVKDEGAKKVMGHCINDLLHRWSFL